MAALPLQLRGGVAALHAPRPVRGGRAAPAGPQCSELFQSEIRPYTIRKGDTLETIASKRGLKMADLEKYNKGLKQKGSAEPGKTIMLPGHALSSRDREILKGIKVSGPRTYPVRKGEVIDEVLKSRGIKLEEAAKLNPGLDLKKLKGGESILLPNGKYTQREKELLEFAVGMPATSVGIPQFGFSAPTTGQMQFGLAVALVLAGYGFYVTKAKEWSEKNN